MQPEPPSRRSYDRNGFENQERQNQLMTYLLDQELEEERRKRWQLLLPRILSLRNSGREGEKRLISEVREGVCDQLRHKVWPLLIQEPLLRFEDCRDRCENKEVNLDLERTFPTHKQAKTLEEGMKVVLNALVVALPEVGYCQGMNFIVGTLLLRLGEEDAFKVAFHIFHWEKQEELLQDLNIIHEQLYALDRSTSGSCSSGCRDRRFSPSFTPPPGSSHFTATACPPVTPSASLNSFSSKVPVTALRREDTLPRGAADPQVEEEASKKQEQGGGSGGGVEKLRRIQRGECGPLLPRNVRDPAESGIDPEVQVGLPRQIPKELQIPSFSPAAQGLRTTLYSELSFESNMHTTPSQQHLRDYLHLGRVLSREKKQQVQGRRCSRSPKEHTHERKVQNQQYRILQERYRQLEGKYRELLQTVQQRGSEHEKLKSQIKTYQKNHERDMLQIERLRCIIGLVKKRSVSIQVEEDQLDNSFPRGSRLNKFDQSTEDEIKLKTSAEKVNPKEKTSPYKAVSRQREEPWEASKEGLYSRSRVQYGLNQTEKDIGPSKYSREVRESISSNIKLSNSPYSKLRFVPAASYK